MKKDNIFYYKNKHGIYYSPDSIRTAFYIYSGHIWYENMRKFINFLNKIWGKNIIAVCHPTYEELIKNKQKVLAIKMYRDIHHCSLIEAKDYIYENYIENI